MEYKLVCYKLMVSDYMQDISFTAGKSFGSWKKAKERSTHAYF